MIYSGYWIPLIHKVLKHMGILPLLTINHADLCNTILEYRQDSLDFVLVELTGCEAMVNHLERLNRSRPVTERDHEIFTEMARQFRRRFQTTSVAIGRAIRQYMLGGPIIDILDGPETRREEEHLVWNLASEHILLGRRAWYVLGCCARWIR